MPREVYLTAQDVLAAVEELECDENEPLDIDFAPPEVAVVSDEENLDENNLTEGNILIFPMHQVKSNCIIVLPRLRLQQKNLPRKDVKNTMILHSVKSRQWSNSKNCLMTKS